MCRGCYRGGERMKIVIEATPKEIADFVLGLQNQLKEIDTSEPYYPAPSTWVLEGESLRQKRELEEGIRLAVWEQDAPPNTQKHNPK